MGLASTHGYIYPLDNELLSSLLHIQLIFSKQNTTLSILPSLTTSPNLHKMAESDALRLAARAEQDLNSYQAKQGLGPKSDSSM